jgi:hypothetical protein
MKNERKEPTMKKNLRLAIMATADAARFIPLSDGFVRLRTQTLFAMTPKFLGRLEKAGQPKQFFGRVQNLFTWNT